MPTGKHLSNGNKAIAAAAMLVVFIVGASVALGFFNTDETSEPAVTGTELIATTTAPATISFVAPPPTDTVEVGAIDAVGTGRGQDELYLRQKGEILTRLLIDEHSYCTGGSGGLPCMEMSSMYSASFGGKRALIDGNRQGDSIVVRRLRIMEGEEIPRVIPAGTVYIPWMHARTLILGCQAQKMVQTHEGLVLITQKDGTKVTAVEPVIDEVFTVANEATAACGPIGLGTE